MPISEHISYIFIEYNWSQYYYLFKYVCNYKIYMLDIPRLYTLCMLHVYTLCMLHVCYMGQFMCLFTPTK